jgi:hypothetical protein
MHELKRKTVQDARRNAHLLGLVALQSLLSITDPLEKEEAFSKLRESIYMETSTISSEDLDRGDFDLYSIEWKWRLLDELHFEISPAWVETAVAQWRWSGEF